MTIWPAYAAFQERELGSLTPGKHADFVVLDQDLLRIPDAMLSQVRVRSTWFAGRRSTSDADHRAPSPPSL